SRASLMSGLRPDTLRIWNLTTHLRTSRPHVVTLPEHFKKHGYFTQNIGKIYHNWRQEPQGDPRSWSVPAQMHFASHGDDKPVVEEGTELPANFATTPRTEIRDVPDEAYFDGRISALACDALRECAEREQPFFLAIGFWKPHLPFNPPKKYWDLYDRTSFQPALPGVPPEHCPALALHDSRELLRSKLDMDLDDIQELKHGYLAGISFLDAQVGKLLTTLDELQLRDRTVIVFWSDHGFHLGEHGLWCKTSNFEFDARVPLLISYPGLPQPGESSPALAELVDLSPTLVDLCGLPPQEHVDGVSLRPILEAPTAQVKQVACTQHPRPAYYAGNPDAMGVSIRTERYRYTEWRDFVTGAVRDAELYDHSSDPGETRNVVSEQANRALRVQLANELAESFPRVGYAATERTEQ
ncbi:MAG: sulfatase, partial [Planctomycetaceae bacterium]|nr:sulfatase [Planctomycetaceae bacterium]